LGVGVGLDFLEEYSETKRLTGRWGSLEEMFLDELEEEDFAAEDDLAGSLEEMLLDELEEEDFTTEDDLAGRSGFALNSPPPLPVGFDGVEGM